MSPRPASSAPWSAAIRAGAGGLRLPLAALCALLAGTARGELPAGTNGLAAPAPRHFLTHVVEFRNLSGNDYLDGCAFRLDGVVTLVDTNRNLLVLQDATAAVALNFDLATCPARVGQAVSVESPDCSPYVAAFPDYPFRPSGWDIQRTLEAPSDWGDYHLTRMRGLLQPPVSGEYTFWIASDNSSELWLSTDADPSTARKIAFLPRFSWVNPHEWSKFPSQRSETVLLERGKRYYIEALQEQTTAADHVAVAWQGPSLRQSVIASQYLAPWSRWYDPPPLGQTSGILREYWTNYSAGSLAILSPPRPFQSALSVRKARVSFRAKGELPVAVPLNLSQRLVEEDNYRWVEVRGRVKFAGMDGHGALLEVSDGQSEVQVRVLHWSPESGRDIRDSFVRAEGVCEGAYDRNGLLVPGLVWATAEDRISLVEAEHADQRRSGIAQSSTTALASTSPAMTGFYATRGVVTFNDRVLDKDYLYVQEESASVFVSLKGRQFKNEFEVGRCLELGGALLPGKPVPVITPLALIDLGWRAMPIPAAPPARFPIPETSDGKWTEFEGVAHRVHSNGTICVMSSAGPLNVWIGHAPANHLSLLVDARLRARGVLSLSAPDAPLLLVPSRSFLEVEDEAPADPFAIPVRPVNALTPDAPSPPSLHRIRLVGEVTYRHAQSFVIQDQSGGLPVQALGDPPVKIGDAVEVVGFPAARGSSRRLSEALVRFIHVPARLEPTKLDLGEALSFRQSGKLVHVSAALLSQKTVGSNQILELQEQHRIFAATLPSDQGELPVMAPGSRVRITGVCDNGSLALRPSGQIGDGTPAVGSLGILLRGPADVTLLSGPPWWTWKRTVALVGTLLTVSAVALLWVQLLRHRLERQHAARLAFSRQILQGQEGERQRIAINLHDSLGQNLLVIKHQARLAMEAATDEAARQQRLHEISEITSQAIEEVRQITHDLRPYQLDRLGLTQAIRAAVGRASESSSILFATHVDDVDGIFDKEAEIHFYRVIQEAVNNILKHSRATEAAVVVKHPATLVSISIRDNGCGFDPRTADLSRSHDLAYGLSGMAERVRILGGSLLINSRPAQGTSLTVEIPKPHSRQ